MSAEAAVAGIVVELHIPTVEAVAAAEGNDVAGTEPVFGRNREPEAIAAAVNTGDLVGNVHGWNLVQTCFPSSTALPLS